MSRVESPLNSTFIFSYSLEVMDGLIEISCRSGSQLLFVVKEFDKSLKDIDGSQILFSLRFFSEDGERCFSKV